MTSFPNEQARTAMTTATTGRAFTEIVVQLFDNTETAPARIQIPTSVNPGDTVKVVFFFHGSNADPSIINTARVSQVRDLMIDRGYVFVAGMGGNAFHWASNMAIQGTQDLDRYVRQQWNVSDVLFVGESMGGLTATMMYGQNYINDVRACASVDGALSILAMYNAGYGSAINTAYGANSSTVAALTLGHDTVRLPVSMFAGKNLWIESSPNDTTVAKVNNSDVFVANVTGQPNILQVRTGSGAHVAVANYMPTDMAAFIDTALRAPQVPNAPGTPKPSGTAPGLTPVTLNTWVGGVLKPLSPR